MASRRKRSTVSGENGWIGSPREVIRSSAGGFLPTTIHCIFEALPAHILGDATFWVEYVISVYENRNGTNYTFKLSSTPSQSGTSLKMTMGSLHGFGKKTTL